MRLLVQAFHARTVISVECTATELVAEVTQETVFFEIINVLAHILWSHKKQPSGNLETDFSRQYDHCRCQLSSSMCPWVVLQSRIRGRPCMAATSE